MAERASQDNTEYFPEHWAAEVLYKTQISPICQSRLGVNGRWRYRYCRKRSGAVRAAVILHCAVNGLFCDLYWADHISSFVASLEESSYHLLPSVANECLSLEMFSDIRTCFVFSQ